MQGICFNLQTQSVKVFLNSTTLVKELRLATEKGGLMKLKNLRTAKDTVICVKNQRTRNSLLATHLTGVGIQNMQITQKTKLQMFMFAFHWCDKTDQNQLGVEKVYFTLQVTVNPWRKPKLELEQEAICRNWHRYQRGILLACLLSRFMFSYVIPFKTACPEVTLPTVGWVFPHQS